MSTPEVLQLLARAEAALALRRWAEAEGYARDALAVEPDDERAHALLSRALASQGRHSEAVAIAERGLAASPESEWLHRVRSFAFFEAGHHSKALLAANEALRIFPDSGPGHHLRSLALNGLGRCEEARTAAERAVTLSPETPEFRAQLGDAWLKEDPARAERHYRESLAISPEQPLVLNNLGVALLRQRRRGEAALAFKSALLLDPGHPLPKRNTFAASAALLRASPLSWVGIALTIPVIGFALYSGALHGRASALAFGAAAVLLAVQLGVGAWARRIGLRRLERLDPQLHTIRRKLEADLRGRTMISNPVRRRRLTLAYLAFGVAMVLGSITGEVFVVREYLGFPAVPRRVTVEGSHSGEWVELERADLDCSSRQEINGSTYFLGRSSGGRHFVASYDELLDCDHARPKLYGVISDLNPRLAATLTSAGVALPQGSVAGLCVWCGPRNSALGILILLAMAALGAWLAWTGVRSLRQPSR